MKALYILLIILIPFVGYGQLGSYYKSENHPKAKGLNFQIKVPLGFQQKEADRPNIVQKWVKDGVTFMVMVKNLDEDARKIPTEDWIDYFKISSGLKDMTSEIENVSNLKYYVIDNYPGIYYEIWMDMDRIDYTIRMYMSQASVFVEEHMFIFQLAGMKEDIIKYSEIFNLMSNSIIFPDQYN
jgi:hypothetical protein